MAQSYKEDANLDNFVFADETKIKWSSVLKRCLLQKKKAKFVKQNVRLSCYRPFCKQWLYFDFILNQEGTHFSRIFPTPATEAENRVICVTSIGSIRVSFFMTSVIPALNFFAGLSPIQCFPFYTYDEEGTNRQENLTDFALEQFQKHYHDQSIQKWDVFYYIYGVLHHPQYAQKYAANLRRELPRIPFVRDFWKFSHAGKKLGDLHVNYENAEEYPLKHVENPGKKLDWRVEKMRVSPDKTAIVYNDFLTLEGIPPQAWEYKLGNRSALAWVIKQYQVTTDKRSGITNDPNRPDDPSYIVRLIGKIITVSLETQKIVEEMGKGEAEVFLKSYY